MRNLNFALAAQPAGADLVHSIHQGAAIAGARAPGPGTTTDEVR